MAYTQNCRVCGASYEVDCYFGPSICPACDGQERQKARLLRAAAYWEMICPPLFKDTDPEKLPCKSKIERAYAWEPQHGRGLLIHGTTGKGKSRLAWLVLKRLHDAGWHVRAMGAVDLGTKIAAAFGDGQGDQFMQILAGASLLFLDDLGKTRLTERVEEQLFWLIDKRGMDLRPTIYTTNGTGEQIASMFSPDRGGPIVRRLREYNECIGV